jgi:hypothetical protein
MKVVSIERGGVVAAAQWQQIKQMRHARELLPIETSAGVFQFDYESEMRLRAVVESCSDIWHEWYDVDNHPVEFSPSDLRRLYYDLIELRGKRILALGAYARELRAQLPLPEDHPALNGHGWPG